MRTRNPYRRRWILSALFGLLLVSGCGERTVTGVFHPDAIHIVRLAGDGMTRLRLEFWLDGGTDPPSLWVAGQARNSGDRPIAYSGLVCGSDVPVIRLKDADGAEYILDGPRPLCPSGKLVMTPGHESGSYAWYRGFAYRIGSPNLVETALPPGRYTLSAHLDYTVDPGSGPVPRSIEVSADIILEDLWPANPAG